MELLERGAPLAALEERLAGAATGPGSMTLVAGEAGVGKTSLARAFGDRHRNRAHVWLGACDALRTPWPLGPLHDIARAAGGDLAATVAGDAGRQERFTAFLDALASPLRPVVAVLEDVHWADDATLDLLVFVARRVADTHAVVLVTYRDDELRPDHPLRTVLGRLANLDRVYRLRLARLSASATAALVGTRIADADRIHEVTGGNPFFVTEMLAADDDDIPETIRDATLARVARLSAPARAALETVAVVPDHADLALVRTVTGDPDPAAVEECVHAGMLEFAGRSVHFRHELARLAVEQSISPARLPDLHAGVYAHLASQPDADLARLVYHADQAGNRKAVLTHAPTAGALSAELGAHRQAADHYELALRHADTLHSADHAELLERYAEECVIADRAGVAIEAIDRALDRWRHVGDADRAGAAMARRAMLLCLAARHREADELAREAVALLERRSPGPALAAAYASMANVRMLADDNAGAVAAGARAVELAEQWGSGHSLARALNALGSAYWITDPDQAEAIMTRCIAVARDAGSDRMVSAAMVNMASRAAVVRRYQAADHWLSATVEFCTRRDLDSHHVYALAWSARCHFEQGRWRQADTASADAISKSVASEPAARMVALTVQSRLRTRRGGRDGGEPMAEAWRLAEHTGELQRLWPVAAGRAEAAWLAGRPQRIPALVSDVYALARRQNHPWAVGELAFWLWRAGVIDTAPRGAASPYARQMDGDWHGAASDWDEIGCPYEAASARTDSDDPDDLLAALVALHRLGARPAADRLSRRLRALGVRPVPGAPRRSTQQNPDGLTDRQLEVLALVTAGLSNAAIATRLHISPRTADHHVAAILAKLGATTRHEAADTARRRGLVPVD